MFSITNKSAFEERIFALEQTVAELKERIVTLENKEREAESRAQVKVIMGPMNADEDKHPAPIIAACYYLNHALPRNAVCGKQPSYYLGEDLFDGKLNSILSVVGDRFPKMEREEMAALYKQFFKKYKTQQNLIYNRTDLAVYFCDWMMFARDRGFSHNDYFDYELYRKEPAVRDTFLNEGYRNRVKECCIKAGHRRIMQNKAKFNTTFMKYVKRDWLDGTKCTIEEFGDFVKKHNKFFVKPICGTGGAGARVICADDHTLEELYDICKNEKLVIEEIIKQHALLGEFNESTLNTVRINTLLCADGTPRVLLAVARFGRSGNVVDNFHGGGVCAVIDVDTGLIVSEAINRAHIRGPLHPDSKKSILGFQYPHWDDIKNAVCDAAQKVPTLRHIGWDVSVTENGDVEFVEGNSRPNFDVLQSSDQVGRRHRYTPYLPKIEEMEGIVFEELEPLVIDITGMEA